MSASRHRNSGLRMRHYSRCRSAIGGMAIRLPPLRERLEDLPELARYFMSRFAKEQGRPAVAAVTASALAALTAYPWPGNIRELRTVLYADARVQARRFVDPPLRSAASRVEARSRRRRGRRSRHDCQPHRPGRMNLRDEIAALERFAGSPGADRRQRSPCRQAPRRCRPRCLVRPRRHSQSDDAPSDVVPNLRSSAVASAV